MYDGINLVNLTSHPIDIVDGNTRLTISPSGIVARVVSGLKELGDGFYTRRWGDVIGLPEPKDDTIYIVSAMVAGRVPDRTDVASPATDLATKDAYGKIKSVPGLIINR